MNVVVNVVVVVNGDVGDAHVNAEDHTKITRGRSHAPHAQTTLGSHAEDHDRLARTSTSHPSSTAANAAPAGSACTTKIVHFAEYAP